MNIGGTHAMSGKFEVQALSTVVIQVEPISAQTMEEVNANVDQLLRWMEKAVNGFPGLDILVTSEMALQGAGPFMDDILLDIDGPELQRIKDKCRDLQIWAVVNPLLKAFEGEKCCNVAMLINDNGEVAMCYSKMNPWLPAEHSAPGHKCPVVDGPKGAKIGIIICADGDYPEAWREPAANGANIIIRVSHYMAPWDQAWEITNKAGAYFNQCYVVAANAVGIDEAYTFGGRSMILNPDGTIIVEAAKGIPWMIKADLYPQIVDHIRIERANHNFTWSYCHRGAAHPDYAGRGVSLGEYNAYRLKSDI